MRPIQVQLPGNAGENPGLHRSDQDVLVNRGIFVSHKDESHNVALYNQGYNNLGLPMSKQKSLKIGGESGLTQWAADISLFMKALRLSQQALAAKLNVSQAAVNQWVNGKKEPSAENYYRMARLDQALPESRALAERARILSRGAIAGWPEKRDAASGASPSSAIEIPLMKETALPIAVPGNHDVERSLYFPRSFADNAHGALVCFKAQDDAMSPLIDRGYLLGVDLSQTEVKMFKNEMAALYGPHGEFTARWVRRSSGINYLISNNTTRESVPLVVEANGTNSDGWRIAGKILWWVGMAI
jgi:transcriptional regulator with XRE-family HTH domain